ncbi:PQQ-dependent sugar dehydrogenase [Marisediminicola antarctica]
MWRSAWGAGLVASVVVLAGCSGPAEEPTPVPPVPSETGDPDAGPVQPVGDTTVIATGLTAPWSMVRLASGSTLISERDSARVMELTATGEVRDAGVVGGVVPGGEGGLLGLAVLAAEDDESADAAATTWLYAYFTASDDNRIVRMPLEGDPGAYSLGVPEDVLIGIPKSTTHNGGRLAFGPDGMLYATAGDAGEPDRAQDVASLGGKILRMLPDGAVPSDNPFPDSLVFSLGHRNSQGLAWDRDGLLWAAEFGQNQWDELNVILPGQNYGWPEVEGIASVDDFVDPVQQWATSEASPSGLAFVRDTFFLAALRGERVWAIYPGEETIDSVAYFQGEFGRLRDVAAGPDGTLWMLTNNTDGRGEPTEGDDKIIEVRLAPPVEG